MSQAEDPSALSGEKLTEPLRLFSHYPDCFGLTLVFEESFENLPRGQRFTINRSKRVCKRRLNRPRAGFSRVQLGGLRARRAGPDFSIVPPPIEF